MDHNSYPPSESFLASLDLAVLSTPVAYLATAALADPFGTPRINLPPGDAANEARGYAYLAYNEESSFYLFEPPTCSAVPYAGWSLVSQGPDRTMDGAGSLVFRNCPVAPQAFLDDLSGQIYDPTNGTTSRGDIIRFSGTTPAAVLRGTD